MVPDAPAADGVRLRAVLLARADGHRDALHDEWGAAPERPPVRAPVTLDDLPATPRAFARQVFPWSAAVRVERENEVLLVRGADAWRLPGGPGRARETMAGGAERLARVDAGANVAVTGLASTRLVEFDCGAATLPVRHACFTAEPVEESISSNARWVDRDDLPADTRDPRAITG